MIPFLDHILVEMQDRFSSVHQQKVKLLGLIPSIAVTYDRASVEEVGQLYETDLPFPQVLGAEYRFGRHFGKEWPTKTALIHCKMLCINVTWILSPISMFCWQLCALFP